MVTVHDVMPLIFPRNYPIGLKGKVNFYLQKRSLNKCKKIITVSQTSKDDIVKLLKIKADKIVVIPEAASDKFKMLSEGQILNVKRRYKLPDRFLLYIGDANFVKNLPFLIDSFQILRKKSGFGDLNLVLVGGVFLKKVDNIDHPELESLKQVNKKIKDNNLEDFVIRPGQVNEDNLVGFYNLATVYVQPSIYEGFGIPLVEAFSCGTPVICSNTSSLPEVGGDAAIYFDPKNKNQFISLLEQILKDSSLQTKLSKLGLKRAAMFSWEKVALDTLKLYEEII